VLAVALLLLLALVLAIVLMQNSGGSGGGGSSSTSKASLGPSKTHARTHSGTVRSSSAPARRSSASSSSARSSSPATTSAPSSSPSPTSATTSVPASTGGSKSARLAQAIANYYALLPGDTAAAWNRLTPSYQSGRAGGRSSYDSFWSQISQVTTSNVSGTPPDGAEATVTYYYKDGRVIDEDTAFRLVRQDGILKIDSSTVLSSNPR
jgi:hypothetical protein